MRDEEVDWRIFFHPFCSLPTLPMFPMNIALTVLTGRAVTALNAELLSGAAVFLESLSNASWTGYSSFGSYFTSVQQCSFHTFLHNSCVICSKKRPCLYKQLRNADSFYYLPAHIHCKPSRITSNKPQQDQDLGGSRKVNFSSRTISGYRMEGTGLVVIYGQSNSLVKVSPITDPLYLVCLRTHDTSQSAVGKDSSEHHF